MKFRKKLSIYLLWVFVFIFGNVFPLMAQNDRTVKNDLSNRRKAFWGEFHKIRFEKYGKFQEIDIYAEDDKLTRICYISGNQLLFFYYKDPNNANKSHIEKMIFAKRVMLDRINRITYDPGNQMFHLWYYGKLELSIK